MNKKQQVKTKKIRANMHFEVFAYCMIDRLYGINIKYEKVRKNEI